MLTKKSGVNGEDEEMQGGSGSALEPISYSCDTCGVDCTNVRYHSIRHLQANSEDTYDVCPACYTEGRFPSNLYSGDFLRIDSATSYRKSVADGHAWSDQETLLLLEGMEMFNDDWDRISEHVASRTREECISHFLQLPIEDEYLVNEGGMSNGAGGLMGRVDKLPFSQPDHPVLSVVAFLASVVDPEIAAKAASESVQGLTEQLKRKAAKAESGDDSEKSKDAEMAVDGQDGVDSATTTTQKEPNQLHRSAYIALSSAAAKAHLLAQQTSSELTSQIHQLVSIQISKLNIKLSQLDTLESALDNERRQLEQSRSLLTQERLGIAKQLDAVAELSKRAAMGEAVPLEMVEQVRMMGQSQGTYRSGMAPRVTQTQQGANGPLNGQGANFTSLD